MTGGEGLRMTGGEGLRMTGGEGLRMTRGERLRMTWRALRSFDKLRMSGGKEVQDERILRAEIATLALPFGEGLLAMMCR
jgi:hypothetical protein